jgi:hypothetical protein
MRTEVRAEQAGVRTRCARCGKGLAFDEWSSGLTECERCMGELFGDEPAATFVRGPGGSPRAAASPARPGSYAEQAAGYEQLLDDLPEELIAELVAALEAEAAKDSPDASERPDTALRELLEDIGFGSSQQEFQWAGWGFAAGFALNVAMAKYAQMTTAASMSQFLLPMVFGGVVAGAACAAIGWGFAKLRER